MKLKDRYRDKNEEGNSYTGFCINLKKFDNVRLDTLIRFLSLKIFGLIPTVDFLYYKGEENREEIVVVQKMEMYECLPSGFKFSDIKPETAYRQIFELIIRIHAHLIFSYGRAEPKKATLDKYRER